MNKHGKRYIIEAVSGLTNWLGFVKVGEGDTIREAWDDALGDRPWTAFQKKLKKGYYLRDRETATAEDSKA
ncbi:MAG: hypothetical protein EBY29_10230 [Planctomycetes bacterium]|nr:hypothetical protein [Planctomycetota bacterium]